MRNIAQAGKKAVQTLAAGCTSTSLCDAGLAGKGPSLGLPDALRAALADTFRRMCVHTHTQRLARSLVCDEEGEDDE